MLAFTRRSAARSDLNTVVTLVAALRSPQSFEQAPQQGAWCACTLQRALLRSSQTVQSSANTEYGYQHHGKLLHWAASGPGTRGYSTQRPQAVNAISQANMSRFEPVSLSNLTSGNRKTKRKRRARGGGDKQAGRGYNGQKSRSGTGKPALFFEGGQTPMWKMLPKRGFTNNFRCEYDNVLLSELDAYIRAGKLDPTKVITIKHMYDAGLIEKKAYNRDGVQVLAKSPSRWKAARLRGMAHQQIPEDFMIPVDLEVQRVSSRAREAIERAGGRVTRTYYNPLGMRAVLLPDWFVKKGRLLPRAVQMVPYKKQWRFDCTGTIPARDSLALEDMPPPEATDGPPSDGGPGGGVPENASSETRVEETKVAAAG